MPPRYTYWTIIVGGQSTAFRAATRDELLPTLKQLQSKQPDAVMMWFARGKVWPSEEAAAMALRMDREQSRGRERRGPGWRPGGQHEDPRDRFKVPRDVKRQRFASRLRRDRKEEQPARGEGQGDRPFRPREDQPHPGRPIGPRPTERPAGARPTGPKDGPRGDRPFRPKEGPRTDRPFLPTGPRGGGKPGGGDFRGGPAGGRGKPGSDNFRSGDKKGGGGGGGGRPR